MASLGDKPRKEAIICVHVLVVYELWLLYECQYYAGTSCLQWVCYCYIGMLQGLYTICIVNQSVIT